MDSTKAFESTAPGDECLSATHVVYSDYDGAAGIAVEWDDLASRVGSDVYSTYDWCRVWWEFYGAGRQLMIVLVRKGDRLVSVMPLFHETLFSGGLPLRTVRIVGCDHTVSTCNVVCESGSERDAAEALARALEETRFPWDVIQLADFPAYARDTDVFAKALGKAFAGCNVTVKAGGEHTFFPLPATFDEYLASLSKKERSHVRRDERTLAEGHEVVFSVESSPAALPEAFQEFVDAHQSQWRARGRLGHFDDWPRAREFHRNVVAALAKNSRVFIAALKVDGETVAHRYCLRFGRFLHAFLTGREKDDVLGGVNLVRLSFARLIGYAIDDKVDTIDAMRGYYDYKLKAGGTLGRLQSITVRRRGMLSGLRFALARLSGWLINKAYYRLWFIRIAPRIGLGGRPLWETWIRAIK
mgnify:CR=1 FL=1